MAQKQEEELLSQIDQIVSRQKHVTNVPGTGKDSLSEKTDWDESYDDYDSEDDYDYYEEEESEDEDKDRF